CIPPGERATELVRASPIRKLLSPAYGRSGSGSEYTTCCQLLPRESALARKPSNPQTDGNSMTTHVKPSKIEISGSAVDPSKTQESSSLTRIGRTYRFESAHRLPHVPDGHKCKNMHGHNYRIEVVISGKLDERGFVADFSEIDEDVLPLIRKV